MCNPIDVDSLGSCCPAHPYIQLKRFSLSTGRWMLLLDACPLCFHEHEDDDNESRPMQKKSKEWPCKRVSRSSNFCASSPSVLSKGSSAVGSGVQNMLQAKKSHMSRPPSSSQPLRVTFKLDSRTTASLSTVPSSTVIDVASLVPSPRVTRTSINSSTANGTSIRNKGGKHPSPSRYLQKRGHRLPQHQQLPSPEKKITHQRAVKEKTSREKMMKNQKVIPAKKYRRIPHTHSHNVRHRDTCKSSTKKQKHEKEELNDVESTNTNIYNNNNFDSKGRCIYHPHVQLRKKKNAIFGREHSSSHQDQHWKTVMNVCPDCCLDEINRMTGQLKVSGGDSSEKNDAFDSLKNSKLFFGRLRRQDSAETASITRSSCSTSNSRLSLCSSIGTSNNRQRKRPFYSGPSNNRRVRSRNGSSTKRDEETKTNVSIVKDSFWGKASLLRQGISKGKLNDYSKDNSYGHRKGRTKGTEI